MRKNKFLDSQIVCSGREKEQLQFENKRSSASKRIVRKQRVMWKNFNGKR